MYDTNSNTQSCDKKINFVLFGAKSTGKTTYIYALCENSKIIRPTKDTQNYIDNITKEVIRATNSSIKSLDFSYKNIDFEISDYDGEYAESLRKDDKSENILQLTKQIECADGLLVFFPWESKDDSNTNQQKNINIKRELQYLVELLKKSNEYRDDNGKFTIPVVIGISKWDLSTYFKQKDKEGTHIKKYLKSNEEFDLPIKRFKELFTNVKIVALSSEKKYNINTPIEYFFDRLYEEWRREIEKIVAKGDRRELLIYLDRHKGAFVEYDNQKYKELYDKTEQDCFDELYKKLKNTKKRDEFLELERGSQDTLNALTKEHRDKIEKLSNGIKVKRVVKYISIIILVSILIIVIKWSYSHYNQKNGIKKQEQKLYKQIVSANKNHDYSKLKIDIEDYLDKYTDVDTKHYNMVIDIKTSFASQCESNLEKLVKSLMKITKLKSQYSEAIQLQKRAKRCSNLSISQKIQKEIEEIKRLQNRYQKSVEILNKIDISNIDKEDLLYIIKSIDMLKEYQESDELKNKLINIIDRITKSDNEDAIRLTLTHLSVLDLPQNIVINLKVRQKELSIMDEYNELITDINNRSFGDSMILLEGYSRDSFSKNQQINLINVLQKKFNISIEDRLKNSMPENIRNIDDFYRLEKSINEIKFLRENGKVSSLSYTPHMSPRNKHAYEQKSRMYMRYTQALNRGVKPKYISFHAVTANNEPLDFYCDSFILYSDDDLRLDIDNRHYKEEDGKCRRTTMTYVNRYSYTPDNYRGKATEWDLFSPNDIFTFSFTLRPNDIIKLENGEKVKKSIKNNYWLTWIP